MTRHAPAHRAGPTPGSSGRPGHRPAPRFSRALVIAVGGIAALLFVLAGVALAYLVTTDSSHPAEALAATLAVPTSGAENGTATPSSVPIEWTAPVGYTPADYTVLRCTGSSCTNFTALSNGTCTGTINGTSCTDTDTALAAGTTYTYEVEADLGNWVSAPGSSFTAATSAVTSLAFTTQPSSGQNIQATGTGTFNVSVAIEDARGNVATHDNSDTVTLAIATGDNPGGGALSCSGGLTATVSSGVASFTGCAITKPGTGYELTALSATDTSLTAPANANSFNITAGTATQLAFTTQPSSGQNIQVTGSFSVSVAVQDSDGNTVTSGTGSTDSVTLAIGANPGGGVLSCTNSGGLTVTASAGVASFTACAITKAGTGYALTAF